jgi:hypothetical protein
LRDQHVELGRPLRRDARAFGDHDRDAIGRKRVGNVGDGNVHERLSQDGNEPAYPIA